MGTLRPKMRRAGGSAHQLPLLPWAGLSRQRTWRRTRLEEIARLELAARDGRLDVGELEGIASDAHRHAGMSAVLGPRPQWLLRLHGVRFRHGHPLGSAGAQLLGGSLVVYRNWIDTRTQGLAILHEFAHWLLLGIDHTHCDVWALTLMLAFPLEHLYLVQAEGWTTRTLFRHQPHVERWALRERAAMARALYRVEAA